MYDTQLTVEGSETHCAECEDINSELGGGSGVCGLNNIIKEVFFHLVSFPSVV